MNARVNLGGCDGQIQNAVPLRVKQLNYLIRVHLYRGRYEPPSRAIWQWSGD